MTTDEILEIADEYCTGGIAVSWNPARIKLRAAIEALQADARRYRDALDYARGGLWQAYDAAEKGLTDEVLLHCGHHHEKAAMALDKS